MILSVISEIKQKEGFGSDKDSKVSTGPGHLEVRGDLYRGHQEREGGRQARAEE